MGLSRTVSDIVTLQKPCVIAVCRELWLAAGKLYLPETDVMANVAFVEYVVMQGHSHGGQSHPNPL